MSHAFETISKYMSKVIDLIIVVMFSVLLVSCITQVFMRTVMNSSPPWTEELARYSFMYVNIIGAAVCVRKKSHARVTAIVDNLGPRSSRALEIFADIVILFVSYIMIRYGAQCVLQVVKQRSPAMRICMSFVYACIPLAGTCIAFEGFVSLCKNLGLVKGKEENP